MNVVIAGCRHMRHPDDIRLIDQAVQESGFEITEVVSGMAKGIDTLAIRWAARHGLPVKEMYANWNAHGRWAGGIRNKRMAEYADAVICIWDNHSKGTENMIAQAWFYKKPCFVLDAEI